MRYIWLGMNYLHASLFSIGIPWLLTLARWVLLRATSNQLNTLPDWRFFLMARDRQEIQENRQESYSCRATVRKYPTRTGRQERWGFPDNQLTGMFTWRQFMAVPSRRLTCVYVQAHSWWFSSEITIKKVIPYAIRKPACSSRKNNIIIHERLYASDLVRMPVQVHYIHGVALNKWMAPNRSPS